MLKEKSGSYRLLIDPFLCHGCGACVAVCAVNGLFLYKTHLKANQAACTGCERCLKACPAGALSLAAQAEAVSAPG